MQPSQGFVGFALQERTSGQIQGCQDATVTLIRWVEVPGMEFWSDSVLSEMCDLISEHMQYLHGWMEARFQNGALA